MTGEVEFRRVFALQVALQLSMSHYLKRWAWAASPAPASVSPPEGETRSTGLASETMQLGLLQLSEDITISRGYLPEE